MVEYIFLFSKSEDYFYDADAVSVPQAEHERTRRLREQQHGLTTRYSIRRDDESHGQVSPGQNGVAKSVAARHALAVKGTRRRRNSDWFTESWQGLMQDSLRRPMAMIVNPQPFQLEMCTACSTVFSKPEFRKLSKDAEDKRICTCGAGDWLSHFATFPERMVTPCILAGTSERGACRHCGNPYTRIADRPGVGDWHPNGARGKDKTEPARMKMKSTINPAPSTLWEATCSHDLFPVEVEPCTVLDPFSGSATSGVVALRHGRSFIGIELSAPYIAMAERRIELAAVSS
jgi:hypothetical protein